MSNAIDLEDVLRVAEGIYKQIIEYDATPPTVYNILGIHTNKLDDDDVHSNVSDSEHPQTSTPTHVTNDNFLSDTVSREVLSEDTTTSSTSTLSAALLEMNDILTDVP